MQPRSCSSRCLDAVEPWNNIEEVSPPPEPLVDRDLEESPQSPRFFPLSLSMTLIIFTETVKVVMVEETRAGCS